MMASTEIHKQVLIAYISNPENPFPARKDYKDILKISTVAVYKHFTPADLTNIENEAYEIRRKGYTKVRSEIMQALAHRAKGYSHKSVKLFKTTDDQIISEEIIKHYPPDAVAAREFFDRTEGKVIEKTETTVVVHPKLSDKDRELVDKFGDKLIDAILTKHRSGINKP